MTTAGTMMTAGSVASMIVPSWSPIPPVTLKAMSAPWATELGAALVSLAAIMLVAGLVAGGRPYRGRMSTRTAPDRIASSTAPALATNSSRVAT